MAQPYEGGCSCGQTRYSVLAEPMIVHCCHCRWCQRQTGSAFAINALVEAEHVTLLKGQVEEIEMASPSGNGQTIARCPSCKTAVWSNYFMGGLKSLIRFVRVGSLDDPDSIPPDVHIFTSSKQPWVTLPPDAQQDPMFYDYDSTWSPANLQRRAALFAQAGIEIPTTSMYK